MNKLALAAMSALALTAAPAYAASFTFEGATVGAFSSVTATDEGLTLTVTSEIPGAFAYVANSSNSDLGRGVIGSLTTRLNSGEFTPLRFSFSQALSSATFAFADGGFDLDSPVAISAFDASNSLLGTQTLTDPNYDGAFRSLTLSFAGAISFVASSGSTSGNSNSLVFEVSSATVQATVPEPPTWGLMLAGFGMVGAGLRTRRRAVAFAAA